jgi:hypothetical protein
VPIVRQTVKETGFRPDLEWLPFELRRLDIAAAMQDVYDFFYDINRSLLGRGLRRFDDLARPQLLSGLLSDLLTDSLGQHCRSLVVNQYHNGHPDLVVDGVYARNAVSSGSVDAGVEVKSTNKGGGAVDTHGGRDQWMLVFVWEGDFETEPLVDRRPTRFIEVYCAQVTVDDFRRNNRVQEVGTNTSTLHAQGATKLRTGWVYFDLDATTRSRRLRGTGLT